MGVSENSVPLNPMVDDHYPYKMAIVGNIPYFQTNPYSFFMIFKNQLCHMPICSMVLVYLPTFGSFMG